MEIINNNPFRILGLPITASDKEIEKRIDLINTYSAIQVPFNFSDLPFLPTIDRNLEEILNAKRKIEVPEKRLLYSAFWFWINNNVDEDSFKLLQEGKIEKAKDNWLKNILQAKIDVNNYSYFRNLSTLFLSLSSLNGEVNSKYLIKGVEYFCKSLIADEVNVFHNSFHHDDAQIMIHKKQLIDTLFQEIKPSLYKLDNISDLIFATRNVSGQIRDYFQDKIVDNSIQNIRDLVKNNSEKRSQQPQKSNEYGKYLNEAALKDLVLLESILDRNDLKYEMIADEIALEILNCSVDYYRECSGHSDYEVCRNSLSISKLALKIVIGEITREKILKDIQFTENILDKIRKDLKIKGILDQIESKLSDFSEDDTSRAEIYEIPSEIRDLLNFCRPKLLELKNLFGITGGRISKIIGDDFDNSPDWPKKVFTPQFSKTELKNRKVAELRSIIKQMPECELSEDAIGCLKKDDCISILLNGFSSTYTYNSMYVIDSQNNPKITQIFCEKKIDFSKYDDLTIDFIVEAQAGQVFGIQWGRRIESTGPRNFFFLIHVNGYYSIGEYPQDWTSGWIKCSQIIDGDNRLTIKKKGNCIEYYINSELVIEKALNYFHGTEIYFFLNPYTKVHVKSFRFYDSYIVDFQKADDYDFFIYFSSRVVNRALNKIVTFSNETGDYKESLELIDEICTLEIHSELNERIKKNRDIIKDNAYQAERNKFLDEHVDYIKNQIDKSPDPDNVPGTIISCLPSLVHDFIQSCSFPLKEIRNRIGQNDEFYLKVSSAVVTRAVSLCIEYSNRTRNYKEIINIMDSIKSFDMENSTRSYLNRNYDILKTNIINSNQSTTIAKGPCFIATMAFGSDNTIEIEILRCFKSKYLETNSIGKIFIKFYYSVSPTMVKYIKRSETCKTWIKQFLTILCKYLQKNL